MALFDGFLYVYHFLFVSKHNEGTVSSFFCHLFWEEHLGDQHCVCYLLHSPSPFFVMIQYNHYQKKCIYITVTPVFILWIWNVTHGTEGHSLNQLNSFEKSFWDWDTENSITLFHLPFYVHRESDIQIGTFVSPIQMC